MRTTPTPHVVHLDRARFGLALQRLAKKNGKVSDALFAKLVHAWEGRWGPTHMRAMVTVRLTETEHDHLQALRLPMSPIECAHWKATYAHADTPSQTEVTITSAAKPPARKTLRVAGEGNRKLIRTSLRTLTASERSITMARVKPKTQTAPDDDDILAGLEDLEDDVDTDDEDDDIEDVEEAPVKPQSARAKRAAARKAKAAAAAEVEDDDDDDDEDEEPVKPARRSRKPAAKPAAKPARAKPTPPAAKALPTGKLSASDIADQVGGGVTGRDVRMYLRKHNIPVDAELGRYAFTAAQAKKVVAAIVKSRKG